MKTAGEIIERVKNNENIDNSNILEMLLYMNIEIILKEYASKIITKEEAQKRKIIASKNYNDIAKQYEFERSMFKEHIQNLKDTEMARIRLRKLMHTEGTEETIAEALNVALEIIEKVFKEVF